MHLAERSQRGDLVAFELLMDLHRASVRGHALKILRCGEDADDATQEAFVKAYRALHTFEVGRPLLPWLLRICTNCCYDILRDRKTRPESIEPYEYSLNDGAPSVADGLADRAESERLMAAIERLPEQYRQIVVMRHCEHMDVGEIAAALARPEGTIKSWLFRARALLRQELRTSAAAA